MGAEDMFVHWKPGEAGAAPSTRYEDVATPLGVATGETRPGPTRVVGATGAWIPENPAARIDEIAMESTNVARPAAGRRPRSMQSAKVTGT